MPTSSNSEGKVSPPPRIIKVQFPGDPKPHLAAPCLDEDHLASYISYLDSIERSERSTPENEYAGCNVESLRQLISAQPSEKRQNSVRKSVLNKEEFLRSSGRVELVLQFLKLFPEPSRLHGELENLHPILRSRNDLHRLALQEQSALDIRHYAMISSGVFHTHPIEWSTVPGVVNNLIVKCLVPDFGQLCMNRPCPAMWYEHVACRIDRRTGDLVHICGKYRGQVFERLSKVKSCEERLLILGVAFFSWRLSTQAV
eukprot:TRINITY_DN19595_c0_g1_i1.p1 TRINITY_DN19595_c0_g1~~TRINITY_DN19595_c0_g1_i1.p1  ORF type:complete len:271 (-),score=15.35 TRINITY_DN19595_c0_g1_i1:484-1254(-)